MTTLTATELKNQLGEAMERAQREPITVKKAGRPYAVILGSEEYERLQAMEDYYWAQQAQQSRKTGYVGSEKAMEALHKSLEPA